MKAATTTGLRIAAWSTVALVGMGAAAGAASALGSHNGGGGFAGGFGGPGGGGKLVHSIATVKLNGAFRKVADQRGTVSDINAESITVTSADEYAATYVITGKTKIVKDWKSATTSDISDGDTVFVHAIKKHGKYDAVFVFEGSMTPPSDGEGGQGGHGGPGGWGGPPPTGAPTDGA